MAVAISYGKLIPLLPTKEQIADSRVIKAAADKVIALDATNDLGWQVLGRWYLNLAEVGSVKRAMAQMVYGKLPDATFEDAARCFEKAIRLNPNRLMHYIELGRTYADMGRTDEARRFIARGLAMPNTEKDDPESKGSSGRELGEAPGEIGSFRDRAFCSEPRSSNSVSALSVRLASYRGGAKAAWRRRR